MVRDLLLMGRRNFLNSLSALGVSSSAVEYMTKEDLQDLTDDPSEEVPRLSRLEATEDGEFDPSQPPQREAKFYTIPRDVWEYRQACRKASNKLNEEFGTEDGLIRAEVTTETRGQNRRRVVRVVRNELVRRRPRAGAPGEIAEEVAEPDVSLEELRGQVPAEVGATVGEGEYETHVDGIPVVVEEGREEEVAYYDYYYDSLPAGVQYNRADGTSCTLCCPVYDEDAGNERLLTAGHCIDGYRQERIYQPDTCDDYSSFPDVGFMDKIIYEYGDNDAATLDLTETARDVAPYLGNDSGGFDDGRYDGISGVIGYDELEDNVGDESYEVYRQGRTTGRSTNYIEAVDNSNRLGSVTLSGEEAQGGDSGGPMFWQSPYGHDYMAGMTNWRSLGGARGNVMEFIETEMNLSVYTG